MCDLSIKVLGFPLVRVRKHFDDTVHGTSTYQYFGGLCGRSFRYWRRANNDQWNSLVKAVNRKWPGFISKSQQHSKDFVSWRLVITDPLKTEGRKDGKKRN